MVDSLSPRTRRVLQVMGPLLMVVGFGLFLWQPFRMFGITGFEDAQATMPGMFGLAVLGIVLIGVGASLARFGFMKKFAEVTASETSGAVEHAAGALGRGLASAGVGGGAGELIRIKCRSCGFLDSEDASFCSGCGAAI